MVPKIEKCDSRRVITYKKRWLFLIFTIRRHNPKRIQELQQDDGKDVPGEEENARHVSRFHTRKNLSKTVNKNVIFS